MKKQSWLVFGMAALATLIAGGVYAAVSSFPIPVANGHYRDWFSTVSNVTAVDEWNCDGDGSYVSTDTVGARDSYKMDISDIPPGSVIRSIVIKACAANNLPGPVSSTMKVFYRYNDQDSADAPAPSAPYPEYNRFVLSPVVGTSRWYNNVIMFTEFNGLSHTRTWDATLEIGAVYHSGMYGVRLSAIRATTTYDLPAIPNRPTGLAAVNGPARREVVLEWRDNSLYETGFAIERSSDNRTFTEIATVGTDVYKYSDTSITTNGYYYYRVRAYNVSGHSPYTSAASVKVY